MIDLTVAQIAAVVGGELADISAEDAAALHVTGTVEFDSRKVTSGGLFLALPGARSDGHDHAASAVAAGASGSERSRFRKSSMRQAIGKNIARALTRAS